MRYYLKDTMWNFKLFLKTLMEVLLDCKNLKLAKNDKKLQKIENGS